MVAFAVLGWMLDRPFRTLSSIIALAVVIYAGLLAAISKLGYLKCVRLLDFLAAISYISLFLAAVNILVFSIWKTAPYYPNRSAWVVVIGLVFLATHELRSRVYDEVLILQRNRLEAKRVQVRDQAMAAGS